MVGVKTCDVFLCCVTIVVVFFIALLSLFSLFYVIGKLHSGFSAILCNTTTSNEHFSSSVENVVVRR